MRIQYDEEAGFEEFDRAAGGLLGLAPEQLPSIYELACADDEKLACADDEIRIACAAAGEYL